MISEPMYISSKSNQTVLWAASLQEKKYRDAESLFLVEGKKLFEEAVASHLPITHVFVAESKREAVWETVEAFRYTAVGRQAKLYILSDGCFQKISTEKAPQGIIAVVKHLDFFKSCIKIDMSDISKDTRALFLYSVRDPGNLGAIIRSAVAFGTDTLILSHDCADIYNPKTVRAAMGCLFHLKVFSVEDAEGSVTALRQGGRRIFAAELSEGATSIHDIRIEKKDIFVIGNEGHGIPASLSKSCNGSVYLPIDKAVDSLNASVAASILLWEQGK